MTAHIATISSKCCLIYPRKIQEIQSRSIEFIIQVHGFITSQKTNSILKDDAT